MYRKVQKSEVCSSLKFHKMNIPVEPVCKLRNGIFPEPQRCFFESRPLLQAYIPSIRFFWTVRNWKHTLCTLLCLASVAQHYVCELYLYCWQVVFITWTCPIWSIWFLAQSLLFSPHQTLLSTTTHTEPAPSPIALPLRYPASFPFRHH